MKNRDEDLVASALLWDVRALRASKNEHAARFLRALQLVPSPSGESSTIESPLDIASQAIELELAGRRDEATAMYRELRSRDGAAGLLGAALCAWGAQATHVDLTEYASRLPSLESRNLRAHAYCQLMTWAKLRGWGEMAKNFHSRAVEAARGDLRIQLANISHNFFGPHLISFEPVRSRLVTYDWIHDTRDSGTYDAWMEVAKRTARGDRRVIRFGGTKNRELRSAELQAEWAGAYWLLPSIWRSHAAILLAGTPERSEIEWALSMWVKGGTSDVESMFDRFEHRLEQDSAARILQVGLNSGVSAYTAESWHSACRALWDQLPADIASSLITGLSLDLGDPTMSPQSRLPEVSLFALLSLVDPDRWFERFIQLSGRQQLAVVRSMSRAAVARLSESAVEAAAASFRESSQELEGEWWQEGWTGIGAVMSRAGTDADKARLGAIVPQSGYEGLLQSCPQALGPAQLADRMTQLLTSSEAELEQVKRGTFSFGATPEREILALANVIGMTPKQAEVLHARASNPHLPLSKRTASVTALHELVDREIVRIDDIRLPLELATSTSKFTPWDDEVELRRLRLEQVLLNGHWSRESSWDSHVVEAAKDPDPAVRARAVSGLIEAAVIRRPLWDATFLGALYDPDPAVQAVAIRSLTEGLISDDSIARLGWERTRALWTDASRSLRRQAASLATRSTDQRATWVVEQAANDRSLEVRHAVTKVIGA